MLIRDFSGSEMEIISTPVPMTISDKEIMANARRTELSAISLRNTSIRSFPLARLNILRVAMANVLVFIPPPVEDGEAPIHIRRITIIRAGKDIAAVSMELKPAVRGVVAPKRATTNFPKPSCSASVLLYSSI